MDWRGLVAGELRLTFDILFGLLIGFAVLRSGLADRLMRRLVPHLRKAGIGSALGMALTLSLGSAKAGAAFIASALDSGDISERSAKWGTLLLSFPAYLHRWPSTMVMAASMAGASGAIFGAILLLRSAARFVLILFILKRGGEAEEAAEARQEGSARDIRFNKRLLKTLPVAWLFFAIAYIGVSARGEDPAPRGPHGGCRLHRARLGGARARRGKPRRGRADGGAGGLRAAARQQLRHHHPALPRQRRILDGLRRRLACAADAAHASITSTWELST